MGRSKVLEDLQSQTLVPNIWNNLPIDRYMNVAARMFEEAMSSAQVLTCQYVSLKRFLNFATKIYNHNGYEIASNKRRRGWMKRAVRVGMVRLEEVAKAIEEEANTKVEEMLFDMLEDEMHAPLGVASVLDALPLPVDPTIGMQTSIEAEMPSSDDVIVPPKAKKTLAEIYNRLRIPDSEEGGVGKKKSSLLAEYEGIDEGKNTEDEGDAGFLGRDFPGISINDAKIMQHIGDIFSIGVSIQPFITEFSLLGGLFSFLQDDYHVSFTPVLDIKNLSPSLQISRSAVETNRCFFLHLGIAVGIHPFALQTAFRNMAAALLEDKGHEDASLMQDILPSVLQYAGLVDANALIFLFPQEFVNFRLCIISGSPQVPLISCFSARSADPATLSDVLIYCDGEHFTLLRPCVRTDGGRKDEGLSIVPDLLQQARAKHCVVQEHRVPISPAHSIWEINQRIVGNL